MNRSSTRRAIAAAFRAAPLFVAILLVGCGESGPKRYHISGKVEHGGKPIPAGSVMLAPDTSKGNKGPATSIPIKDGVYDSRTNGVGHVGGPHIVKITGLNGESSDEFSAGTPLFPTYEMEFDLPKEAAEQDLEVPGDHTMPKQQGPISHGP